MKAKQAHGHAKKHTGTKKHAAAGGKHHPAHQHAHHQPAKAQHAKTAHTKAKQPHHAKARGLCLGDVQCCAAEALAWSLRLSGAADVVDYLLGQGAGHLPGEWFADERARQVADLVSSDYRVDVALVREACDECHYAGVFGELACPDFDTPRPTVMQGDQIARALGRNGTEDLVAAPHQVNARDHLRCGSDVPLAMGTARQGHNGGHGRAHSSVEGPARPGRLAGSIISDLDVLGLYWHTAEDADSGASIQVTLEAAAKFGLAGVRLASFEPVTDLDDPRSLLLGVDLPGPHTVLAAAGGWISWNHWHDPNDFPDAVIEEAWAVTW